MGPSAKGGRKKVSSLESVSSKQQRGAGTIDQSFIYRQSVEEYFSEGMKQYKTELDAEAAEQAAKEASFRMRIVRTPSWGLLGDMLDRQLCHLPLITRACQTDWRWVSMAVRWRHARIIETRVPPPPLPVTIIKVEGPKFNARYGSKGSLEDEIAKMKSKKHLPVHASSHHPLQSHHHLSHHHHHHHHHHHPHPQHHHHHHHHHHRRFHDKGVDTADFDFDPYDPHMMYTPVFTEEPTFLSSRCSTIIHQWRLKTREHMQGRKQKKSRSGSSKTDSGPEDGETTERSDRLDTLGSAATVRKTGDGSGPEPILFTDAVFESGSEHGSDIVHRFSMTSLDSHTENDPL